MANISGNNIDDLFRQASDKYPLRTDSADWGRLSDALDGEPALIQPSRSSGEDRGNRRRFLWLFLLFLPIAGVGYLVLHSGSSGDTVAKLSTPAAVSSPAGNPSVQDKAATANPSSNAGQAQSGTPASSASTVKTVSGTPTASGIKTVSGTPTASGVKTASGYPKSSSSKSPSPANGSPTTSSNGSSRAPSAGSSMPPINGSDVQTANLGGTTSSDPKAVVIPSADPLLAFLDIQRARTSDGVFLRVDVHAGDRPAPIDKGKAAKITKLQTNRHSFYAGVVAAPDFSMIRLQAVKSVGTTYGLLLGYTLNNKWSLETGIYLDRKKYYTDGQYFNKEKVPPLQYVDLQKVDGICNMVELPVNLRYNLGAGQKIRWFATAGLSTYLMSSEWYNYQYLYYGNPMTKSATYKNPSQNWFSIVNLSVGYEQKIGSIGNLRLEPYLRVPLSGIGTGSLPIMSAGLNIGITRRIW